MKQIKDAQRKERMEQQKALKEKRDAERAAREEARAAKQKEKDEKKAEREARKAQRIAEKAAKGLENGIEDHDEEDYNENGDIIEAEAAAADEVNQIEGQTAGGVTEKTVKDKKKNKSKEKTAKG